MAGTSHSIELPGTTKFWFFYCLAWLPYGISYAVVFFTESDITVPQAVLSAARNVVPAAVWGVGVIWACKRISWSLHRRKWFFALHVLLAIAYTLAWNLTLFSILPSFMATIRSGRFSPLLLSDHIGQWQLFSGIMIYFTIASVTYALIIIGRLKREEERARTAHKLYEGIKLKALDASRQEKNHETTGDKILSEKIFVREGEMILPVESKDIVWLEADGDYVNVYTNYPKKFVIAGPLRELSERLDNALFFKVHRSAIVNLNQIEHIEEYDRRLLLHMKDGSEVQASRGGSVRLKKLVF